MAPLSCRGDDQASRGSDWPASCRSAPNVLLSWQIVHEELSVCMQESERSERTTAAPQAQGSAERKAAFSSAEEAEEQAEEMTAAATPVAAATEEKQWTEQRRGPAWLAVEVDRKSVV